MTARFVPGAFRLADRITLMWHGFVNIKTAGLYRFQTVAAGFTQFQLNGQMLMKTDNQGHVVHTSDG